MYFALAGGRHLRKFASKRCSYSPAPMAFPYPFCFPSAVAVGKRIRKNHTRPASFCTNHLASCFDDSAKGAPASSARKRACARNRSLKVALAGKSIVTVRNTNLKISITCGRFRSSEAVKTEPSKERKRAGRKISPRPLKTGLKTSTERKTICQDTHLYVI